MSDARLDTLRDRVPAAIVREPAAADGRAAAILVPSNPAEVIAAVQAAAASGLALVPRGGGRALGLRRMPERPHVILSTERLSGVVDHPADDLTVTVQAGTPMRLLDEELSRHGQWLPVESHDPDVSTVGGLIGTDSNGPLRGGHGSVRDYLLGISIVDGGGRLLRLGGRVVKNVAGYDLGKLLIGAWGGLGVIVEATFRVVPEPERRACILATLPGVEAGLDLHRRIGHQGVAPVAFEVLVGWSLRGAHESPENCRCCIAVEGFTPEVDWQCARIREALADAEPDVLLDAEAVASLDALRAGPAGDTADVDDRCAVRAAVLPTRLPELCAAWRAVRDDVAISLAPLSGIGRVRMSRASADDGAALVRAAERLGGHARFERLPGAWLDVVDPAGTAPTAAAGRLARGIATIFDPHGILPPVAGGADV